MVEDEPDAYSDDEARQRTETALRRSFALAPKTHQEMVKEGKRARAASKALKDGEKKP